MTSLPKTPAASFVMDASDGMSLMAAIDERPRPDAGCPQLIGSGETHLVLAGILETPRAAVFWRALALALHDRRSLVVMDLGRLTFVVAPSADPEETRLTVVGELDLATSAMFAEALAFALHRQPARVVLDLRRLTFIDGRSAAAIAAACRRMREWEGTLAARGAQVSVRRVFDLCGLDALLSGAPGRRHPVAIPAGTAA